MLNIGINNYISTAVVTSTGTSDGRTPSMVKDATITHWQGLTTDETLSIQIVDASLTDIIVSTGDYLIDLGDGNVLGAGSSYIDMITAHRISFADSLTIETYFAGVLQGTQTYNSGDLDGIEVLHLFTTFEGLIDRVDFIFSGGSSSPSIGYVWVGSKIEFDATAYQDADNSSDIASVSQGGYAGNSRRPLLRGMQVTVAHESAFTLKNKIRQVLRSGYSVPRPIVRIESCLEDEVMLGIFDSSKVGYDFFENKDQFNKRKSQVTIGISEVLGVI